MAPHGTTTSLPVMRLARFTLYDPAPEPPQNSQWKVHVAPPPLVVRLCARDFANNGTSAVIVPGATVPGSRASITVSKLREPGEPALVQAKIFIAPACTRVSGLEMRTRDNHCALRWAPAAASSAAQSATRQQSTFWPPSTQMMLPPPPTAKPEPDEGAANMHHYDYYKAQFKFQSTDDCERFSESLRAILFQDPKCISQSAPLAPVFSPAGGPAPVTVPVVNLTPNCMACNASQNNPDSNSVSGSIAKSASLEVPDGCKNQPPESTGIPQDAQAPETSVNVVNADTRPIAVHESKEQVTVEGNENEKTDNTHTSLNQDPMQVQVTNNAVECANAERRAEVFSRKRARSEVSIDTNDLPALRRLVARFLRDEEFCSLVDQIEKALLIQQ